MDTMETNNFEKFPGDKVEISAERTEQVDAWKSAMAGAPEFGGEGIGTFEEPKNANNGIGIASPEMPSSSEAVDQKFGIANPGNNYYGEARSSGINQETSGMGVSGINEAQSTKVSNDALNPVAETSVMQSGSGEERNDGIADAAALINYGLNAAAMQVGVETVVQKIKNFDASGREDPIGDLFDYLGVSMPEDRKNSAKASADKVQVFRDNVNAPSTQKSTEGAFKALDDMKELISEVEGADPRYKELRQGAKTMGKGYFDYAVMNYGTRGLTELFDELAKQRENANPDQAA